jgi:WD40 repeat protein
MRNSTNTTNSNATLNMISADRGMNIKISEVATTTTTTKPTVSLKQIWGENLGWRQVQNAPSPPRWDVSPDGQRLVVAYSIAGGSDPHLATGQRTNISIWSLTTGKCLKRWGLGGGIPNGGFCGLAFSTCCCGDDSTITDDKKENQDPGIFLASCMNIQQAVSIWHVGNITVPGENSGCENHDNDAYTRINTDPPPCIMRLEPPAMMETPPTSSTTALAWSPNMATTSTKYLACACWDGSVRLWSVPNAAAFSRTASTNSTTATICKVVRTLEAHRTFSYRVPAISCIVFSPNGKILASGGGNQYIQLWNVEDGSVVSTWHIGTNRIVRTMLFTHSTTTHNNNDGPNILLTGDSQGIIQFWVTPVLPATESSIQSIV